MTSIVIPGMVERRRGAIINLSSASGIHPTPLLTVYSACKVSVLLHHLKLQTVNQLLFVCENFPPSLREPHCCKYLLPWTSIGHIVIHAVKKTGVDKAYSQKLVARISSSHVNHQMKSRIMVSLQYIVRFKS